MTKKHLIILVIIILNCGFSFQNKLDYVPNKETAIKIAEAVWLPVFGERIYEKRPFVAVLNEKNVWHVYGTLPPSSVEPQSNGDTIITIIKGGVPHIFINKLDGKVLNMYHTK